MLRQAEKAIMKFIKRPYRGFFVDIGSVVGESDKIWTVALNESSDKTPLVLLHGLGAGTGLWVMNYDTVSQNRPVYAIDLLGFGRSSRPTFDKDPQIIETQFVKSIEEWRKEVNINKMILAGHSFGGFLASAYALKYPNRIQHLILADSWGFPEKPADVNQKYNVPLWVKGIAYLVQPLNPLWAVRAAGPFGHWVVEKTRPDIMKKFNSVVKDEKAISQYIYQCNAQTPSGESAFHSLMSGFGWAKHPMINRIHEMDENIPITLIYGSRSWVDNASGDIIKKTRPNSYVKSHIINQAGHHVYADRPEEFNSIIVETCDLSDKENTNNDQEIENVVKLEE
ncbi:1-acylglycerol-3-phosphate O-acyltransferase ABHD5-like isoform X2 [Chironomus tepperi]